MTFTQFRIFVLVLLTASIAIALVPAGISVTSLICAFVSLVAAAWIAWWSPETVIALQERYGLDVEVELRG